MLLCIVLHILRKPSVILHISCLEQLAQTRFIFGTDHTYRVFGRLSFSSLEGLKFRLESFKKIDDIALNGIREEELFQDVKYWLRLKIQIILEEFMEITPTKPIQRKSPTMMYMILLQSQKFASTLMAMYLEYRNMLDIDDTLGKYIGDLTGDSPFQESIFVRILAHQSGLKSWIPFYIKTMSEGEKSKAVYIVINPDSIFTIKVAEGMYQKNNYPDIMYDRILSTSLGSKKYKYSDLCYYFTQKVFESILHPKQKDLSMK